MKDTLILLPGLLSNRNVFHHQIEHLQDIINLSTIELTDTGSPEAITDKILEHAPEKFMLAGHSLGGWAALRVMKIAPQRVLKLFLLNTSARGIEPNEIISRQLLLQKIQQGHFKEVISNIAEKFTFNKDVEAEVKRMFMQVGEEALRCQTHAMMAREDLREVLPKIQCATWVVHAEQDQRFTFTMLKEMADEIPNCKFRIIPECGHMSPIEKPEEVTALMIEWINS